MNSSSEKESNLEQTFIDSNKEVSQWFDGVTEGIDLFLVGKKLTQKKNPSGFKIENTTVSTEGNNFTNYSELKLNVRLQNLEQFLQLQFETTDDNSMSKSSSKNLTSRNSNKKYAASVGLFKNLGKVRTSFKPRLELTDPLNISHTLTFESLGEFKKLKFNPKLELFADARKGLGTSQSLNFNYPLNELLSLTWINEFEYFEKSHIFSGSNGLSLGHYLNDRQSLSYNLFFGSNNRPRYHLEYYDLGTTLSQILYKNILDIQLTPHLNFAKSYNFKGQAGLIFTLTLNF